MWVSLLSTLGPEWQVYAVGGESAATNCWVALVLLQEPNFHAVYVAVSEKWNDRKLRDIFIKTTIHYLKVAD